MLPISLGTSITRAHAARIECLGMFLCVYVCVRERKKERERKRKREKEIERERVRESKGEGSRGNFKSFFESFLYEAKRKWRVGKSSRVGFAE